MDSRSYLGALHCPIPSGEHPRRAEAAAGALRFAERHGLAGGARLARLAKADCARLSAAAHRDGYTPEALQLATDFICWLSLHDDLWVDGAAAELAEAAALDAAHRRLLEVARGRPPAPQEPGLAHALFDIRRRLLAFGGDLCSFLGALQRYLTAKSWEVRNHRGAVTPRLGAYRLLRRHGGGVAPCLELAVLVRPIALGPSLRDHACVLALADLANNLLCWTNDIASLSKELAEGTTSNLVRVLREERGGSYEDALRRAVALWNEEMAAYLDLGERLRALPLPEAERRAAEAYRELLDAWIRGNLDYDLGAGRFQPAPSAATPARGERPPAAPPLLGLPLANP